MSATDRFLLSSFYVRASSNYSARMSFKSFFVLIILLVLLSAIVWKISDNHFQTAVTDSATTPSVAPKPVAPIPNFTVIALQVAADNRRVINCLRNNCQPLPAVDASISAAVTDGQSWYHYQSVTDDDSVQKILQLKRTWINQNKSDLVIEQTRLVKPRGLYISPDATKVAFWLDNISEPSKNLTELWLYDADSQSTKLIAEKLNTSSVITEPRWNRASTHLWFLGDTASADKKTSVALHLVAIQPPSFDIAFSNIEWQPMVDSVPINPLDMDPTGQSIAYVKPKANKTMLHIQRNPQTIDITTLSGTVPYLQWLPDGTLIYAVQTRFSFTFWQVKGSIHKHIAKYQGVFQSARSDAAGHFILFNTRPSAQVGQVYALDVATGRIAHQSLLPSYGDQTFLIHFRLDEAAQTDSPDITAPIDDEQVAAFLDKYITSIAEADAKPQRFITTDQLNTVWFDYRVPAGDKKRLLITIKDVIHAEWSISARYKEAAGEWLLEQGNVLHPPQARRVYEWEEDPAQWILKETLSNSAP